MTPFGALLFNTAKACRDKPVSTLDAVLTIRVRTWADEQNRIPDPVIEPALAWDDPALGFR